MILHILKLGIMSELVLHMNAMKFGSYIIENPKLTTVFTCNRSVTLDNLVYIYREGLALESEFNGDDLLDKVKKVLQAALEDENLKGFKIDSKIISAFEAGLALDLHRQWTSDEAYVKISELVKSLNASENKRMMEAIRMGLDLGYYLREDPGMLSYFEDGLKEGLIGSVKPRKLK